MHVSHATGHYSSDLLQISLKLCYFSTFRPDHITIKKVQKLQLSLCNEVRRFIIDQTLNALIVHYVLLLCIIIIIFVFFIFIFSPTSTEPVGFKIIN